MKNTIIIAFFCLFGIFKTNAQVTFTPGIRGGLNVSTLTQAEATAKTDFYIGAFGAINFTRTYTLQPEINYSRQGANDVMLQHYDFNSDSYITDKRDIDIKYISLSLINKFHLVDGFHVMVGPTLDISVGERMGPSYSELDLGINAGLGYRFKNGISLEARFKKGVVDVLDSYDYTLYSYNFGDWNTNNVLQFGVSYAFNLKSKKE